MKNRWVLIIIILIALCVGCYFENKYVNQTFDEITNSMEIYKSMLEEREDNIAVDENINYLINVHNGFHEKEKSLKALIWHTGLKDIEVGISRIITYTNENDYTEAMAETNALIDYCKHYSFDFDISLENIL